jgi:N-acetylmuramoyl-L-alanine amidase
MNHRLSLAQSGGAQLLVSIHMNEYRDRSVSGPQVFYRKGADLSRLLAGCVQEALIQALQPPKERAAQAGDYYILRLEIPSVLVECGFISNPREEKLLLDKAYQKRLGKAVAQGISTYFTFQSP